MIPLSDENPTLRTPIMTWLILGAMFAVWFVVQGGGLPGTDIQLAKSVCNLGMVPGELTHRARLHEGFWIIPGQLACEVDNDRINYLTPLISTAVLVAITGAAFTPVAFVAMALILAGAWLGR